MARKIKAILLVCIGLAMVLTGLVMNNRLKENDDIAGRNAEKLIVGLKEQIELNREVYVPGPTPAPETEAEAEPEIPEMATADYHGIEMIGIIRVPDCGVELPVLSDWNYTKLEYAPCRYSGNLFAGDLIIMGHNYSSHFSPLHRIETGDSVEFEDVNGVIYPFTVAEIEYLGKTDTERLPGEYPLTLFTCTASGQNRFVIRCGYEGSAG